MPSIYDFHHIELDKVGRGKKRISLDSPDGGIKDVLFTPANSRPASRRNSRSEDTKSRLFNQTPQPDSQRRVVKNLLKSNIFLLDQPVTPPKAVAVAQAKSKSVFTPQRRNPITGDAAEKKSALTNGAGLKSKQFTARIQTATLGSTASTCTPSIASSSLSLDSSSLSSLPSN